METSEKTQDGGRGETNEADLEGVFSIFFFCGFGHICKDFIEKNEVLYAEYIRIHYEGKGKRLEGLPGSQGPDVRRILFISNFSRENEKVCSCEQSRIF